MTALSIRRMRESSRVVAVAVRTVCPTRLDSPKKHPARGSPRRLPCHVLRSQSLSPYPPAHRTPHPSYPPVKRESVSWERETRNTLIGIIEECAQIQRRSYAHHTRPLLLLRATAPAMRLTHHRRRTERRGPSARARTQGLWPGWSPSLPTSIPPSSHYSLGESITLASAVQRIGSARRRDGGLQAIHILLHFPQCETELFD